MHIITHRSLYLFAALLATLTALSSVVYFGFNSSIDFSGGTIYQVAYQENVTDEVLLRTTITETFAGARVDITSGKEITISTSETDPEHINTLDEILAQSGDYTPIQINTLSPSISAELVNKSITAVMLVIVIIVLFIAYTFRGVSAPVASWKYGVVAIVALVHDTIIPIGIFAFLGSLFIEFQIDILFVTAILATLGYSVNDTIVVFDRVRENLSRAQQNAQEIRGEAFRAIVASSLNSSLRRSFFTSLTTLSVLIILFVVGGPTTQAFALVLAVGVIAGTYSSLCVACPLLVWLENFSQDAPAERTHKEDFDQELPDDVKRFLQKQKSR